MGAAFRYRGRIITNSEIAFVRQWIAEHPQASRRALSEQLCEQWNWRQANGALCAMVCRGLMLALDRAGQIELPPVRWVNPNPLAKRKTERGKPPAPTVDETPLVGKLSEIRPITFHQVRRGAQEGLFNALIEHYQYLGYTQPVGEHLKYLVYSKERPIGALAWSSAPRHLGPRDRFIGWSAEARRRNIRFVSYNSRFLILPFVRVEHLASHILGCMARLLPLDWKRIYGHPLYYLETFVDPERFRGTCYPGGQLEGAGPHHRAGQGLPQHKTQSLHQRGPGLSAHGPLQSAAGTESMKRPFQRIEVNVAELEAVIDRAKVQPLAEADYVTLKAAVATLGYLTQLLADRKTTIQRLRQMLFGARC